MFSYLLAVPENAIFFPPLGSEAQGYLPHRTRQLSCATEEIYAINLVMHVMSVDTPGYQHIYLVKFVWREEIWFDLLQRISQVFLLFHLALLLGKPSFLVVSFKGTSIPGIFINFLKV